MSKVDEAARKESLRLMTRTERQRTAKKVVTDLLDQIYKVKSVRLGRGTASGWIYITTDVYVDSPVKILVEKCLEKHVLVCKYWDDFGDEEACVSWSVS